MSFAHTNRPSVMVQLSNQAYLNDELAPPPSYSSIFPLSAASDAPNQTNLSYTNNSSLKIYSITTTPESIHIDTNQASNNLNSNSNNNNNNNSSNIHTSTLTSSNLEPISYEELFQTNSAHVMSGRVHEPANFNPINSQSQALLLAQNQVLFSNNLAKQIKIHFGKSYLITHFLFIIAASLVLISFQIILMSNNARLSYLGTGIIGGLTNLANLIVSIATIKYAKLWLLFAAIILHIICMLFCLGGMIIINCIAATKYYVCSATFQPKSVELLNEKLVVCSQMGLKYINVGIILFGAACVIFFLNFFFKLVNVFNFMHSIPSQQQQQTRLHSQQPRHQRYRS